MKNESAFPNTKIVGDISKSTGGMTLRDYFAAKAMQGLIAQQAAWQLRSDVDLGVKFAYRIADAMLAEREKSND